LQTDASSSEASAVGARLRAARGAAGWSLADAAARTGLSRAYISALEHGRSKRPGADALRRLEDVFGPLATAEQRREDIPPELRAAARERRLPVAEVRQLAGLRVRGRTPQTRERWGFILDALLTSEAMDGSDRP
jgi:transcriptional regulator with XRE-family HTH domain